MLLISLQCMGQPPYLPAVSNPNQLLVVLCLGKIILNYGFILIIIIYGNNLPEV